MDTALQSCLLTFHEVRQRPAVAEWLTKLRDHDAGLLEHSLLAGAMASVFAHSMNLPAHEGSLLVTGALLHDVGKLEVPVEVLRKAGALEADERKYVEEHPAKGLFLLLDQDWAPEVLEMVHCHHERLDGSGYPNALHALQVSRYVRMLMLCDIFAALIEKRSYQTSAGAPLDIMFAMETKLDRPLLAEFAHSVPAMAYRAQEFLKLDETGGLPADAFPPAEPQTIG